MTPSPAEGSFVVGFVGSNNTAAQQASRPADVSSSIGGMYSLVKVVVIIVSRYISKYLKFQEKVTRHVQVNGTAGCVYRPAVRASAT
jgi:hypothetical protein